MAEAATSFVSIACGFNAFATAIGESTIIGYIKAVPQEMFTMYTMGKAIGMFFETATLLILMMFGLHVVVFVIPFTLFLLPFIYYSSFMWIEVNRKNHAQF